jgi:hypothetical protein
MGFPYNHPVQVSCSFTDPAADGTACIWKVPENVGKATILEATIVTDSTLNAGTANGREFTLLDAGTVGTAANAISQTRGTATGGTFEAWTANTEKVFTLGTATLSAGKYLALAYNETGSDSFKNAHVHLTVVFGASA